MSDKLISADALRQRMYHDAFETDTEMQRWDGGCWIRYKMFENALEDAPAVNAEPVRHGTWKERKPQWYCSACEKLLYISVKRPRFNYCPFCGAKMDDERGEDGNEPKSV